MENHKSFQFAPGGKAVAKVRLTQVSNNIDESNIAFYAFITLLAYTALQIYRLPKLFLKKNSWFKRLSLVVLLALDLSFVIMFIVRYVRLKQDGMHQPYDRSIFFVTWLQCRRCILIEALAEFELDPRGKPEFEPVFIQQEHLTATVGMSVWFHTIYLLYILSSVNHIYGKSRDHLILSILFQFSPSDAHPNGPVKNGWTAFCRSHSHPIFFGNLRYCCFWLSEVTVIIFEIYLLNRPISVIGQIMSQATNQSYFRKLNTVVNYRY